MRDPDIAVFCWSSWIAPHPPWNPPEPFASLYDPDALPLPHNFDRDVATLPGRHRGITNAFDMGDASPEMLRRVKALYAGSISLIDKGVGRILEPLDDIGLAENTIVSDHGEMMGDHGLWQKGIPYEGSVRVPMLVRLPGRIEAGIDNDEPVSLLDLVPTFLDVAELAYPGEKPLAGASLLGWQGGGLGERRDEMIVEIGCGESRWLSLREDDWKYNVWLADGWRELYNLADDPCEDCNRLLGEVAKEDVSRAGTMHQRLTQWENEHGFVDSVTADRSLVNLGRPPESTDTMRMNGQFPRWVPRLPDEERVKMESPGETVVNAIRHETTFRLKDLNLDGFEETGGSLDGTTYAHLTDGGNTE